MLHPFHDPRLVALSFVVACLASYAALQLAGRVAIATGATRQLWLLGSAFTMGIGIWSMHFVAMLAFRLGTPIAYALDLVILSVLVAIAASLFAFVTISRRRPGTGSLIVASVLMGPAIAGMHYIGMAAVRIAASIQYDGALVTLSVVIAITASLAALRLFLSFRDPAAEHPVWAKPASAVLMGIAISGMHYTGMAAATFVPIANTPTRGFLIATDGLAYTVAASATLIAAIAVAAVLLDRSVRRQIDDARRVEAEQRRIAEALRESQGRLGFALSAARMTLWEVDPETDTIYRPDAISGVTDAESLSAFVDRIHPDDREAYDRAFLAAREGRGFDLEYRLMTPGGATRWIKAKGQLSDSRGAHAGRIVGLSTDVTDRRQLEEQFLQAQKMEVVGQLAGGIAHDFNNLLTVIRGNAELLLMKENTGSGKEAITEVLTASERAAALTRQLLAFSRKQVMQLRPLDINAIVKDLEPMLRRLIGEHIAIETRLDPTIGAAMTDRGQIEQILANLAVNARDAMPNGGTVRIQTSRVTITTMQRGPGGDVPPGSYVVLTVSDTGVGIDRDVQARVFEPFFTTKEAGKGTGLGLSTVYGLVKQSDGYVALESEPGRGTSFTVYLPGATAPVAEPVATNGRAPEAAKGSETILLAEDEPALRRLVQQSLQRQGYQVLEAENGAAAIDVANAYPGRIHAIVTDLVMPEMGGRELVERVLVSRPDLRVVFMSGYSEDDIVQVALGSPVMRFLQKPFAVKSLVATLRELLDASVERPANV